MKTTLLVLRPTYSRITRSIHYDDVIMSAMASQITSFTIVYWTVYSDADQRKHQSSVSLAFVRGIHRGPVNSPHKWPATRKMFPFHDVIMTMAAVALIPWFAYWEYNIGRSLSSMCNDSTVCAISEKWTNIYISIYVFSAINQRSGYMATTKTTNCSITFPCHWLPSSENHKQSSTILIYSVVKFSTIH